VEAEEHSRSVPLQQLWEGICKAFQADAIIGCCRPHPAPTLPQSADQRHAGATSGHERERTQVFTRIIKVPVHKAHAQNEAADAAASLAAEEADEETALSHAASQAVRLILQGRLT
jgi:hypothetical protein